MKPPGYALNVDSTSMIQKLADMSKKVETWWEKTIKEKFEKSYTDPKYTLFVPKEIVYSSGQDGPQYKGYEAYHIANHGQLMNALVQYGGLADSKGGVLPAYSNWQLWATFVIDEKHAYIPIDEFYLTTKTLLPATDSHGDLNKDASGGLKLVNGLRLFGYNPNLVSNSVWIAPASESTSVTDLLEWTYAGTTSVPAPPIPPLANCGCKACKQYAKKQKGKAKEEKEQKEKDPDSEFYTNCIRLGHKILIVCYYKRKRYSFIYSHDDTNTMMFPEEWPEDVKEYLAKYVSPHCFRETKNNYAQQAEDMTNDNRFNQKVKCPVTGRQGPLSNVVITLNDHHGWTREQIADWLETLDDQPKFTLESELEAAAAHKAPRRVFEAAIVDEMQPT